MRLTVFNSRMSDVKTAAVDLGLTLADAQIPAARGLRVIRAEGPIGSEPGMLVGRIGQAIAEVDGVSVSACLGNELMALRMTLAVAESCTGGLLGSAITEIPGSSAYFLGGVVAYADSVKHQILKVRSTVLAEKGAVSREAAVAMALGIKKLLSADCAVSITGIAGPEGGSIDKPNGTVYIGFAGPSGAFGIHRLFSGARAEVRRDSVRAAISGLWTHLRYGSYDF